MNTEDEYIVKIDEDGRSFYYKNKKLHREAGPAIVSVEEKEKYTGLSDEDLYVKVFAPVMREKKEEKIIYHESGMFSFEAPITYYISGVFYYLEDVNYSEKEFNSIILKQKIEKELLQQEKPEQKKPKL